MKIYTRYFAFSLLFFSTALSHAALQNGKVQVAIIKGVSSLTNPQSIREPMAPGKLFEQGYKVETTKDSTVELCLSNGSTILINPETSIEIRTFRQVASNLIVDGAYQKLDKEPSPSVVEVFVSKGKIIGEVRKLNPQSSFTIKSPAGVARIRGTVYSVQYSQNEKNRTGNMEVACVKGSVEVTVNGSNSGPTPVDPGRKMNAVAPIDEEEVEANKPVPAVPVTLKLPNSVDNSSQVAIPSIEGLVVGSQIKAPGVPGGVSVTSIEDGKIVLNEKVSLLANTEITIDPPPGAVYVPGAKKLKKGLLTTSVTGKNVIKMQDTQGMKVGMKIRAPGFPTDVEIVSIDPITKEVTLSVPVTANAGTEIIPVLDVAPPPAITNPVVVLSYLGPDEVKGISADLGNGTSLSPKIKDEVKDIADKTPPLKEKPNNGSGNNTPSSEPENNQPTSPTNNNPTSGGVSDIINKINDKIQETIEKEIQKNPSPTQ